MTLADAGGRCVRLPDLAVDAVANGGDSGGQAMPLLTTDPDGAPRAALISAAECLIVSPSRLLLAVHEGSRTTRNLRERPIALLLVVAGGVHRVRLEVATAGPPTEIDGVGLVPFRCDVMDVEIDLVAYAEVTTAITFWVDDPVVEARWRRQGAWLLTLAGGSPEVGHSRS